MGQKANSNVLRLGTDNNFWTSKYIGKIPEEFSLFVYQDLKIKNYINRFFNLHGILIDNCYINRSNVNMNIYISYFVLLDSIKHISKKNEKLLQYYPEDTFIYENERHKARVSKYDIIRSLKKAWNKKIFKKKVFFLSKPFIFKLISCLNLFLNKNYKIKVIVQNINKGASVRLTNSEALEFRKLITQLRYYSKAAFFKEAVNILLSLVKNQSSAKIFSDFIALKLSYMKRHNYFINFLKRSLNLVIGLKFSCIKGVKIKIKGRFNGAPRAKLKLIQVGEIPLQTLKTKVSYYCSTSFTPNGTFGVQLWIS